MVLIRIFAACAIASLCGLWAQEEDRQERTILLIGVQANGDVSLSVFVVSRNPQDLEKTVRNNFSCNWRDINAHPTFFSGTCEKLLNGDGTVVDGLLRLSNLTSALQTETGVKRLTVSVSVKAEVEGSQDRPVVDSRWTEYGRENRRRAAASYFFRADAGESPPDLPVRAGHRLQPGRLIVPLMMVLFIPVLTAVLLTKRGEGRTAGSRLVWLSWINLGTFIYWISAASLPDLAALCSRFAPGQPWLVAVAGVAFFSLPLLTAIFLCLLVSHPPADKGELAAALKRGMTAQALSFVPLSFIVVGAFMFSRSRPVGAVTLVCAFLSYRALTLAASHFTFSRIRLLNSGELRNRVSALAAKAGVKVQNLYLLRTLVPREVNAYALRGGNVMLTESLLRAFPRREVDAVMAHEIGHLRGRHIAVKTIVMWGAIFLSGPLMGFLVTSFQLPEWFWHVPILAVAITFLLAWISQRNEFSADAQAAQITGDPEAKIAALARLTKLTQSPVDWGGIQGSILSHPSMRARVLALGRRFNVPDERALAILDNPDLIGGGPCQLPELENELENLQAAVAAEPEPAAPQTYALPAELATGDPLFNTGAKQRVLVTSLWMMEALVVLLPPALHFGIHALPHPPKTDFLLGLAGLVVCFLIVLWTEQWLQKRFYRRMRAALTQRLKVTDPAAMFAGLCPGPEAIRLEGFPDWDLGFLSFEGCKLVYRGERTSFSVDSSSIIDIRIIKGPLYWARDHRVLIRWTKGSFSLRLPDYLDANGQARRLRKMLDAWRVSSTPALDEAAPSALPGAPVLPKITEVPIPRWKLFLRVAGRAGKVFVASLILNTFVRMATLASSEEDPWSDQAAWTAILNLVSFFAAPLLFFVLALPVFLRKPRPAEEQPNPSQMSPAPAETEPVSSQSQISM